VKLHFGEFDLEIKTDIRPQMCATQLDL